MDTFLPDDWDVVLHATRAWSSAHRFKFLQLLLRDLEREVLPYPRQSTMEHALGLLATDRPPPTDEEVKQWLEEERMKKYG